MDCLRSLEPSAGLDPRTLGSQPQLKAVAQLRHLGAQIVPIFIAKLSTPYSKLHSWTPMLLLFRLSSFQFSIFVPSPGIMHFKN